MSYSYEKYFCHKCHKNILKAFHENNCKLAKNNNISNNSFALQFDDKNKKETYNCPIYEDDKEDYLDFNSYNDCIINDENENGNEDAFSNEGIIVSRQIGSNFNSNYIVNESDIPNITNNSLYYDGFNSYSGNSNIRNIDINQIIEKLNVNTINDDINKFSNENCVICLELFKKGDNYIILPCIHYFHENCIKKWIHHNNKCPICNFEIN